MHVSVKAKKISPESRNKTQLQLLNLYNCLTGKLNFYNECWLYWMCKCIVLAINKYSCAVHLRNSHVQLYIHVWRYAHAQKHIQLTWSASRMHLQCWYKRVIFYSSETG